MSIISWSKAGVVGMFQGAWVPVPPISIPARPILVVVNIDGGNDWLNMMPPGHQPPPKKVLLDLRKANRSQLEAAGVLAANIFVSDLCTGCRRDLLFSYRKEGAQSGRMMAVIGIRNNERKTQRG